MEDMPNRLRPEGWEGIGQPKARETAVFWAEKDYALKMWWANLGATGKLKVTQRAQSTE